VHLVVSVLKEILLLLMRLFVNTFKSYKLKAKRVGARCTGSTKMRPQTRVLFSSLAVPPSEVDGHSPGQSLGSQGFRLRTKERKKENVKSPGRTPSGTCDNVVLKSEFLESVAKQNL